MQKDLSIIKHIEKYCAEIKQELSEISCDKEVFWKSSVYRNSLALCVLQIGELVGLLSDDFKKSHPDIDWRNIKAMRNIVAHKYGSFDFDVLWETVTENIPELQDFCEKELSEQSLTSAQSPKN